MHQLRQIYLALLNQGPLELETRHDDSLKLLYHYQQVLKREIVKVRIELRKPIALVEGIEIFLAQCMRCQLF